MKNSKKPICGATNRQGKPCEKSPLKGRTRCKLHGGKSLSGAASARTSNGLYSQYMTEAEQDRWGDIQIGVLDDELRMLRVYLARCVALDAKLNQFPDLDANGMEPAEVKRSSSSEDGTSRVDVTSKRPDVIGRMNMLLGRIGQLEKVRAELIAANTDDSADKAPLPWQD